MGGRGWYESVIHFGAGKGGGGYTSFYTEGYVFFPARNDPLDHEDFFQVSKLFTAKDLLNAGVHFGHHEGCWSPFMKPYLYGSRERYHIFDLDVTAEHLKVCIVV